MGLGSSPLAFVLKCCDSDLHMVTPLKYKETPLQHSHEQVENPFASSSFLTYPNYF